MKLARRFGVLLLGVTTMLGGAVPALATPTKGDGNSPSSVFCDVTLGFPYKTGGSVAGDATLTCLNEANQPVVVDEILGQVALYAGAGPEVIDTFDIFSIPTPYTRTASAPCKNGTWEVATNLYVYYHGQVVYSGVLEGSWFGRTTNITC